VAAVWRIACGGDPSPGQAVERAAKPLLHTRRYGKSATAGTAMADEEQLRILRQGPETWNAWRRPKAVINPGHPGNPRAVCGLAHVL
jgi:hypothetical protein